MKLVAVPGEIRKPSDNLTKFTKTGVLHKHLHMPSLITTRDDIFTTCTLFVSPPDLESSHCDGWDHFKRSETHNSYVMTLLMCMMQRSY